MSACFDYQGNQDINLFPCSSNGKLKTCCKRGEQCASNGMCMGTDTTSLTRYFIRGCTQQDWNDPSCPNNCFTKGGVGVSACSLKGTFCCYGSKGCDCSDYFKASPISVVGSIPTDASLSTRGIDDADASKTTSAETKRSNSLPETNTRVDTAMDATVTLDTTMDMTTAEATQIATSTTSNPPSVSDTLNTGSSHSNDSTLPIGLGVGLGVGIPLLIAAAVLIWFFKKQRSSVSNGSSESKIEIQYISPSSGYHSPPQIEEPSYRPKPELP